jgi:non-specific serine/threonine protein kinase
MARWTFDDFVLDLDARELLRAGTAVALSPKAFQLLGVLVESHGRALSKTELQDRLWPGTFVVEKNLTNLVSEIREALGDDAARPRLIRTVHRFGYSFSETPRKEREAPDRSESASSAVAAIADARHDNLPAPLTGFIGRERELAELLPLLASTRLLTLTGAGGCGKTRLALELAAAVRHRFPDGVWLVDLADLSDPDLVPQKIASVLGIREGPNRTVHAALADYVRNREILLLLDNCEHLIGACAQVADALLRAAAPLCILATSREALGITGETIWRVPSLTLPESLAAPDTLAHVDAISLFVARASAVNSSFIGTATDLALVAEICQRLDGIPLAIELAAARVKVLSIEQIAARLHDRFRLLTGGSRTAVARQRTLEATVDWSYELLSEPERQLLCRLSVFAGGWTIDAAEEVASGDGLEPGDVLDLLSRLVDKSLVNAEGAAHDGRRYRCLETVRQYGRERLHRSGDAARLRDRHLAYFADLIRRAEPELTQADQVTWLNRLQQEHDNLRAALEWCLSSAERGRESVEHASALSWFWIKRGYFREGQACLERALAAGADVPPALQARALGSLGSLMFFQGDFARTRELSEESVRLGRAVGDPSLVAYSLGMLSVAAVELGDMAACARLAAEGIAAARASTTPWLQAISLSSLAYQALQEGDLDGAARLHEEALALSRQRGEKWGMGISLFDLALLRVVQERHGEVRSLCAEGIALYQDMQDVRGIAWCLGLLSVVDATEGRAHRAASLRGAMEGLLESVGAPVQETYHRWVGDRSLAAMKEALGEDAFAAAVAGGRRMSVTRAIELGLEVAGSQHPSPGPS